MTSANWTTGAGDIAWVDNNAAVLTSSGTGTITVAGTRTVTDLTAAGIYTLTGGTISMSGAASALTIQSDTTTISSVLSGAVGIRKSGAGTLVLTSANTYTGTTTVNAGTLQVGNGGTTGSLGSGNIVNNANLVYSFGTSTAVSLPTNATYSGSGNLSATAGNIRFGVGTLAVGGTFTYNATSATNISASTGNSTVTAASASISGYLFNSTSNTNTLKIDTSAGNGPITINGVVSGLSGVLFSFNNLDFNTGSGSLALSGTNTFNWWNSGATITLTGQITGSGAIGSAVSQNGNATLTFNNPGASTYSGVISAAPFNVVKDGTGVQAFSGANTYTGTTTIRAGTLQIGAGGTTGALSASSAITGSAGATLAFNRTDTVTQGSQFNSVIGGAINVAQLGSGTLILSGSNTYTGTTTLAGGVVSLGVAESAGTSGPLGRNTAAGAIVLSGGTLQYAAANQFDYSSRFSTANNQSYNIDTNSQSVTFGTALTSSGGSLTKSGAGTLTLTQDATFSGATTVSGGTLALGNGGTAGSVAGTIALANTAGLVVNRSNDLTLGSVISGSGSLTKSGAGTLTLTQDATFSGATTVSGGTLALGNGGTAGSVAGTIALSNTAGLVVNRSNDLTLGGIISGTGSLTKSGAGTLSLTAANTYSGTTSITAGTLQVGNGGTTGSLGSGNIVNNANLVYSFGTSTAVSLPTNATYSGSGNLSATAGNIRFGVGTLAVGGTFTYNATSATNISATTGNSTVTAASASISGYLFNSTSNTNTLKIDTSAGNGPIALNGISSGVNGVLFSYNNLDFNTGSGSLSITGANTFNWWNSGATITLTGQITGSGAIGSVVGQSGNATLTFNNPGAGTYSGVISSGGANSFNVVKDGAGVQTFSGANTYTGTTTIRAGTLQVGNGGTTGSLGSGNIVNNANLVYSFGTSTAVSLPTNATYSGSGNLSATAGNIRFGVGTLAVGGTFTYNATSATNISASTGNSTVTAASASISGFLYHNGANTNTLKIDTSVGNGPITINGIVSGSSGGQVSFNNLDFNAGSGSLAVTGSNSFSWWTSGATITLTGQITGSGAIGYGNNQVGNATLTFNNPGASTYSGVISSGFFNVVKDGAGVQTFSGANTYTGTTTIRAGTLQIGDGGTTGALSASSAISGSAGATLAFNRSNTVTQGSQFNSVIGGAINVSQLGSGTLILSGSNTYTGTTTLAGGVVSLGVAESAGTSGPLGRNTAAGAIVLSGGTLQYAAANQFDYSSRFSTANNQSYNIDTNSQSVTFGTALTSSGGSLTKSGAGTLSLTAANTYSGATTIAAGILSVNGTAALAGSSGLTIAGGAGLTYTGGAATFGKNITVRAGSGTGTIRNSGGGLLTLSGNLSKDNSVLRLTGGAFNVTGLITGTTVGASDLLVDGTSTVTLSAVNTYSGPTFVNQASNLIVGINNAIPNDSVVTLGNSTTTGTLTLGTYTDAIGGLAFGSGGGTLRIQTTATSAAPLTASTGTMTLTGGTLDLAGSGSTAGLYRVLSAQSIGGSFASITGASAAYQVITSATSVDYQQRAVLGAVTVTNPAVSIITGGSAAFTYTVANSALSGGASLGFSSGSLSNLAGSSSGTTTAATTSGAISGLFFTGTSLGSGRTGTFTVTAPSAYGTTTATGTVSVNVLDHSNAALSLSSGGGQTIITGGSFATVGFNLTNAGSNRAAVQVNSLTNLTGGTGSAVVLSGGTASYTSSILNTTTIGTGTLAVSMLAGDQQSLSGASALQTINASTTYTVLDHALPGFRADGITNPYTQDVLNINFGSVDESAGLQSFTYNLLNLASQTYGAGLTAGLDFTGVTADGGGFASGLTTFNNLLGGGTSSLFTFTFNPTGQGSFSKTFTLQFADNQNLSGAASRRDLTIVANVIVVPEPGAIALAGIGIAAAAWAFRRHKHKADSSLS